MILAARGEELELVVINEAMEPVPELPKPIRLLLLLH